MFLFFDSETTRLNSSLSFPYLYTWILCDDSLGEVERGSVRTAKEMADVVVSCAKRSRGYLRAYAYNLFFDLSPLMPIFEDMAYGFKFFAKSKRDWVTVSLNKGGHEVIRFIDLNALQAGGLKMCGALAGVPKMSGDDFDYLKLRSPETPLTDGELAYAFRDVEIMPAYLETIADIYDVDVSMFGRSIVTISQLARERAKRFLGSVRRGKARKDIATLQKMLVERESPEGEDLMLFRRACMRGAFTFCSAPYVCKKIDDVDVYDISSAYHFYIQSMRTPENFDKMSVETWEKVSSVCADVEPVYVTTSPNPFPHMFHVKLEFTGLRLKGCFADMGIGCLSSSKFSLVTAYDSAMDSTIAVKVRDRANVHDSVWNGEFYSEKLISADKAIVHLSESEYWMMTMMYEWDECVFIDGEIAGNTIPAPDYQACRSLYIYELKKVYKEVIKDGVYDNFHVLPYNVQEFIESGADDGALEVLYQGIKVELNTLFGELVRERRAPKWHYASDGSGSFNDVFLGGIPDYDGREYGYYTQGIRVSGYMRARLVAYIAIADSLGVKVLYGDTDSIHVVDKDGFFKDFVSLSNDIINGHNISTLEHIKSRTGISFNNEGVGFMVREYFLKEYSFGRLKTWAGITSDGKVVMRQSGVSTGKLKKLVSDSPDDFPLDVLVGWGLIYDIDVSSKVVRNADDVGSVVHVSFTDYLGNEYEGDVVRAVTLIDVECSAGINGCENDIAFLDKIGNKQDARIKYVAPEGIYFYEDEREEDGIE